MALSNGMRKSPFLAGVFLITLSLLIFQILQTRILSVIAWYYMAFFAISVAMLGMTVGAVWVYLRRERFQSAPLPVTLSNFSLMAAVAMPASVIVQFCLITSLAFSLVTLVSWGLLLTAMAVPYVFSGVVVSLALTRSPFPRGQVYGVDLLGAASGCVAVIAILNVLDGPTAVIVAGAISGLSALAFAASADDYGTGDSALQAVVAEAGAGSDRTGDISPVQFTVAHGVHARSGQRQNRDSGTDDIRKMELLFSYQGAASDADHPSTVGSVSQPARRRADSPGGAYDRWCGRVVHVPLRWHARLDCVPAL